MLCLLHHSAFRLPAGIQSGSSPSFSLPSPPAPQPCEVGQGQALPLPSPLPPCPSPLCPWGWGAARQRQARPSRYCKFVFACFIVKCAGHLVLNCALRVQHSFTDWLRKTSRPPARPPPPLPSRRPGRPPNRQLGKRASISDGTDGKASRSPQTGSSPAPLFSWGASFF